MNKEACLQSFCPSTPRVHLLSLEPLLPRQHRYTGKSPKSSGEVGHQQVQKEIAYQRDHRHPPVAFTASEERENKNGEPLQISQGSDQHRVPAPPSEETPGREEGNHAIHSEEYKDTTHPRVHRQKAFCPRTIISWNRLPQREVTATTLFRSEISPLICYVMLCYVIVFNVSL